MGMNIIDTSGDISKIFESGIFDMTAWEAYMDKWVTGAREVCSQDVQECLQAGYTWENDYLPVLNAAQFVRFLPDKDSFDNIIGYGLEDVCAGFESFIQCPSQAR